MPQAISRQLRAVWFADLEGYVRLTSSDEVEALAIITLLQQHARAAVERHGGEVVKFVGDGVLASFGSTESAVRSALELGGGFRKATADRGAEHRLRIGVHVGDVATSSDGDVYGDGINVASRLEQKANPGQIIVSEDVWRQLRSRRDFRFTPLGEHRLKGLDEPLELFAVELESSAAAAPLSARQWRARRRPNALRRAMLAAAVVLGALGLGVWWIQGRPALDAPPGTLAVLPFANLSGDPADEYLSDGITEDILNTLAQTPGLRVTARTSSFAFKQQNIEAREIGRRLGVRHILDGSVQRSGDRLRVTVQLVNAADGYELWSRRYDHEFADLFDLEDAISRAVLAALQVRLADDAAVLVDRPAAVSVDAHDLYLRGRHAWRQRTEAGLRQSIAYFREALARAPDYAPAYVGLADAYRNLGSYGFLDGAVAYPEARAAAARAIALDPTLGKAHASFAGDLVEERDFGRAEAAFRTAIELEPNYADAHHWYAFFLGLLGRREDALLEIRRARELDPLSLPIMNTAVRLFIYTNDFDEAVRLGEGAAGFDPAYPWIRHALASAYAEQGRYAEATESLNRALELVAGEPRLLATLAAVHARAGDSPRARDMLARLRSSDRSSQFAVALVHAALGQSDSAFHWLARVDWNPEYLFSIRTDPFLDSIRPDPRYAALLESLGLTVVSN